MPSRIPESVRWAVIENWMLGHSRTVIATECQISTGAVSSIVEEWKYATGSDLASFVRGIGVTLRKLGMSPADCMTGLRVANLFDRIGLDEDSVEAFLSDVYSRLREVGANPKHIAKYVEGFISFLDGKNNDLRQTVVSSQKIDEIFEKMRQDKSTLEEELKECETKVGQARLEVSLNERALQDSLLRKKVIEMEIKWKSELGDEMRKHELTFDDLFRLVGASGFFKDQGFKIEEMLTTFSRYKKMEVEIVIQQQKLSTLNERILELDNANKSQEELLSGRRLKNNELDQLEEMGFGLRELKVLKNLISEISSESGHSVKRGEVVREFISDIEQHYDDYLRLRNKVRELKSQESSILTFLGASSRLGYAVKSFLNRKPTKNDLEDLIEMIEVYPVSEPAAAGSVLAVDREKTGKSDLLQDSTESEQREQEQIRSTSEVQKEGVYIPEPGDPIPSSDMPDYYEVDTGANERI